MSYNTNAKVKVLCVKVYYKSEILRAGRRMQCLLRPGQWRRSWGGQRGQLTPHFWERGVCCMILTPHFLLKSLCVTAQK